MPALRLYLENCYGIRRLTHNFDFGQSRAIVLYAPNGSMKTSLANTFADLSSGNQSKDRIFPHRSTVRTITDDAGAPILPGNVLVLQPYDEVFGSTAKVSTLLVNKALRDEFEKLHRDIDASKDALLKSLKTHSGSRRDLAKEISTSIALADDQFYTAVMRVKDEVFAQKDAPFATVRYDKVFDEKVIEFLKTKDFRSAIKDYIERYDELLGASTYFRKGIFNYYNAATIAKSLADNGFFRANHAVLLNGPTAQREIGDVNELEQLIQDEKETITEDAALKAKFKEIEKLLDRNITLRDFYNYLLENPQLLPELANPEKFRVDVWKSYFKEKTDLYVDLVDKIVAAQKKRAELESQAAKERTQWHDVIDLFNRRFYVPFTLVAKNHIAVILGHEPVLNVDFVFTDGGEQATLQRDELLQSLSQGEKKALYILNILFEVRARINAGQETLFVIDDIADSFDYKNKYAIIEFLREMAEDNHFRLLVLTHNFDFYRTVSSRIAGYGNSLIAIKTDAEIKIERATGISNVFVNDWKGQFFADPKKRIASIPFLRNLIEYTRGEVDPAFTALTSFLHWKSNTDQLKEGDLDGLYNATFGTKGASADATVPYVQALLAAADSCLTAPEGLNFENKIVLSIAIRLLADRFMISKIADPAFVAEISRNQTSQLFARFKRQFPTDPDLPILQRVLVMTPENLHLNSFMYEPIVDMSDKHLRTLYTSIKALP